MASSSPIDTSPPRDAPGEPNLFERWSPLGWIFFGALVGAELLRRWLSGDIPADLSAYIAAAETFTAGQNPYGPAFFEAPSYGGYVYVYPPGSLPFLQNLTYLSPRVVTLLDGALHAAALTAALAWIRRYFSLTIPLGWLSALAIILYWPVTADFIAGNLATYMFALFVGCMGLAYHRSPRRRHLLFALIFGFLLALKPMWGLPAGLVLLARRRWGLAGALAGGAACMGVLSVMPWHGSSLFGDWWARIEAVRTQYHSVDMLSLMPRMLPVVATAWVAGGVLLIRRLGHRHPYLWVWATASLFAWPRLGFYSFILAIPMLAYLWTEWNWKATAALAIPAIIGMHLFRLLLPESQADYGFQIVLYVWVWVLASCVFGALWRTDPAPKPDNSIPT